MTLIRNLGESSISVGVPNGIGRYDVSEKLPQSVNRISYQELSEMLVVQFSRLQDPLAEVHSVRVLFNPQEKLEPQSATEDIQRASEAVETYRLP